MFFSKTNSPKKNPNPATKPAVLKNLPTFTSDAVLNFAYGNGKFVAIAGSNSLYQLLYSEDGENWQVSSFFSATFPWTGLFFANGLFIVFQGSGYPFLAYSTDGVNWNSNNLPTSVPSIATYGNNKFVGIYNTSGGLTKLRISSDGFNWSPATSNLDNATYTFIDIKYGYIEGYGHTFIAVGSQSEANSRSLFYSNGGENWQRINIPSGGTFKQFVSVAFGTNKIVAISHDDIIYSENGIDWTVVPDPPNEFPDMFRTKVVFFNNKFYIFGSNSYARNGDYIWTSTDGINWSAENGFPGEWTLGNAGNDKIALIKYYATSESQSLLILEKNVQFPRVSFFKSNDNKKITFNKRSRGSIYTEDPYYDKVALLLDFENGLKDESKHNHSITTFGDISISESDKKFGTKSLQVSNNYLEIQNTNGAFNLGSQDFTIECWVKGSQGFYGMPFIAFLNTNDALIHLFGGRFSSGPGAGGDSIFKDINNTQYRLRNIYIPNYSPNLWYHYAVVRGNGKLYFYIDGILQFFTDGDNPSAPIVDFFNINGPLQNIDKIWINRAFTFIPNYINGHMDNIRITIGHARYIYPNNFTPEDFEKYQYIPPITV